MLNEDEELLDRVELGGEVNEVPPSVLVVLMLVAVRSGVLCGSSIDMADELLHSLPWNAS